MSVYAAFKVGWLIHKVESICQLSTRLVGQNKIRHNKPTMDKRVGRTKYPCRGWVSALGTSADVIGHEEIPSRKYEIVWLIDYIQICIGWLITHEFVCVNLHVWIRIIGDLTCTMSLRNRAKGNRAKGNVTYVGEGDVAKKSITRG